jgi:hypothetical protein
MWIVPLAPDPRFAYAFMVAVIIAMIAVCQWREGAGARETGLRLDNLLPVLGSLAMPLAAFILFVVAAGTVGGTLKFGTKFFSMLVGVPLWALIQQYMLLAFVHRRFKVIFKDQGAMATAALFSFLHLPNPALTIVCALGGYIWARQYDREPNLFASALTHAVASAFLANSLPRALLRNMVVGYMYFFR